jgi:hypothetical protein
LKRVGENAKQWTSYLTKGGETNSGSAVSDVGPFTALQINGELGRICKKPTVA